MGGTNEQIAADMAAIHATLRKRQDNPTKAIKKEEKSRSRPRTSNGMGSSVFEPFVIDD